MRQTKIIAIANQKGGVAKTTTAAAFASGLKLRGYSVLAIDLDPQGNLSDSSTADNNSKPTIYDVLKGDKSASEAIQHLDIYDIIPANILLSGAEQEISQIGKEQRLKEALETVKGNYDFIIVDTPPALGLLTINAFTAAQEVLIPTTAGIFAASGITQLYDTIRNVKKYCNPNVEIIGVLLTKYNPRTNNSKDMKNLTEKLAEYINAPLYQTYIRQSVIVEEAQTRKVDLFSYRKDSTVVQDYDSFINEYLEERKVIGE